MTPPRNGRDVGIGSQPVLPPRPADLSDDDRVMVLYILRAVTSRDDNVKLIVAKLNDLRPTVSLSLVYSTLEYAVRVCPFLLADAVQTAITTELRELRDQQPTTL